ncbi:hypothetical protein JMUB6875_12340 [Nocardia sp. JMUB6875]
MTISRATVPSIPSHCRPAVRNLTLAIGPLFPPNDEGRFIMVTLILAGIATAGVFAFFHDRNNMDFRAREISEYRGGK